MKLYPVEKAPDWLKIDPVSNIYWVDIYRAKANPRRLTRSTRVTGSVRRAKETGEKMISDWLGQKLDGTETRIKFSILCDEAIKLAAVKRKGTANNARIYIGQIKELIGHLYLDQINEGLWNSIEAKFRIETPAKHFFNLHKHMSTVMTLAARKGLLDRPWKAKMLRKDTTKQARVLTQDEIKRIYENATPTLKDEMLFASTMGMRLREHLKLSWSQVDLENGTLTLTPEHTKTKKGRVIDLSPQVLEMLKRRKSESESKWVFPARGDKSRPTNSNKNSWKSAKREAGIKGRCRYHDLRHTFLTECAKQVREGRTGSAMVCSYAGLSIRVFEKTYLHLSHMDTAGIAKIIAVKLR
jgi:integrase